MRVTRKQLLNKKMEPMKTFTDGFHSQNNIQKKLPPIKKSIINLSKMMFEKKQTRKQTETTESSMFQSFYQTKSKKWLKPKQAMMQQLSLWQTQSKDIKDYSIKLNDKLDKNVQKIKRIQTLVSQWLRMLKKAVQYVHSTSATTDHLYEEVKYWRLLARKFDQLQYQFGDEKAIKLISLMSNIIIFTPQHKQMFDEFIKYKQEVIKITTSVKRLHLNIEQGVSGLIYKLQQNSNIVQSFALLKRILLSFQAIRDQNPLLEHRLPIIYEKIQQCMTSKLLNAAIYPRQLVNISSVKEKYEVINEALSFYSNFISVAEEAKFDSIVARGEYTQRVLVNLLQILSYFQFLYKTREVLQFSKLFSYQIDFDIYDVDNAEQWGCFMLNVTNSMEKKAFEV